MASRLRTPISRAGHALSRHPPPSVLAPSRSWSSNRTPLQQAQPDPFAALDADTPPPPPSLPARNQNTFTSTVGPSSGNGASSNGGRPGIAEADEADAALADGTTDWSRSFSGLSQAAFSKEVADILLAPLDPLDVEIKPDGIIYLPEIKYRRILNRAFGPGGWGLAPRSASTVTSRSVSREYALVCLGRLVSLARGEQDYFSGPEGVPTAAEGCRSNALMRCCKDLGVASELWDPNYIAWWKKTYATMDFVTGPTGKKRANWTKKRSAEWKPDFLR